MNKAHPVYQAAYAHAYVYAIHDSASEAGAKLDAEQDAAQTLEAYHATLAADYPKLEVLARAAFEGSKKRAVERWCKDPDSILSQVVKDQSERLTWDTMGEELQQEWFATVAGVIAMLPGDPLK